MAKAGTTRSEEGTDAASALGTEKEGSRDDNAAAGARRAKQNTTPYPPPLTTLAEHRDSGVKVASQFNYHGHRHRCRQPPKGDTRCAEGRGQPESDKSVLQQFALAGSTNASAAEDGSVGKISLGSIGGDAQDGKLTDCDVVPRDAIEAPPSLLPPPSKPVPLPDDRVICLTLERPTEEDRYVVEFNAVMSSLVRCNTCNVKLSASADAKSCVYYLVLYLSKNPVEPAEVLTLLHAARLVQRLFPSTAADADENPKREAMHLLSKLLNKGITLQEYSLEQCAAALLGVPSSYCSATPTYTYVWPAVSRMKGLTRGGAQAQTRDDRSDDGHEVPFPELGSQFDHLGPDFSVGSEDDDDADDEHSDREDRADAQHGPGGASGLVPGPQEQQPAGMQPGVQPGDNQQQQPDDADDDEHSGLEDPAAAPHDPGGAAGLEPGLQQQQPAGMHPGDEQQQPQAALEDFLRRLQPDGTESDEEDGCLHGIAGGLAADVNGDEEERNGPAKLNKSPDDTISFVQQHEDYYYRPRLLWFLNYLEFTAIFQRREKRKDDEGKYYMPDATTGMDGRPLNAHMEFRAGHALRETHYLVARSKHFTPLAAGRTRPTRAMFDKDRTRRTFIDYYLTLLVPWFPVTSQEDRDFAAVEFRHAYQKHSAEFYRGRSRFCLLMSQWAGGIEGVDDRFEPSGLERARYYTFVNMVNNLNVKYEQRLVAEKVRFRSADRWDDMDPEDVPQKPNVGGSARGADSEFSEEAVAVALDAVNEALRLQGVKENLSMQRQAHVDRIGEAVKGVFDAVPVVVPPAGADGPPFSSQSASDAASCFLRLHEVQAHLGRLEKDRDEVIKADAEAKEEADDSDGGGGEACVVTGTAPAAAPAVDTAAAPADHGKALVDMLNAKQRQAHDIVVEQVIKGEQALELFCGGGGSGKTFCCAAIGESLKAANKRCVAAAFMWSAVFAMKIDCPRSSLHNLFGAARGGDHASKGASFTLGWLTSGAAWPHVDTLRSKLEDVDLIFIDEISTVDTVMFVCVDVILRQAFDRNKPFGGKSICLLGDFQQLPPTTGTNVAEALVGFSMPGGRTGNAGRRSKKDLLNCTAAASFRRFRRTVFEDQNRAQTELQRWRVGRFDLSSDEPPITADFLRGLQVYSPELIKNDEGFQRLEHVAFAVQTNHERLVLQNIIIKRYGQQVGKPIFRWLLPVETKKSRHEAAPYEGANALFDAGAVELEVLWVQGMPMMFGSKQGHVSWKITNGRLGTAHSFTHDEATLAEHPNGVVPPQAFTAAGAGSVFTIPVPQYLNVVAAPLEGEPALDEPQVVPVAAQYSDAPFEAYVKHAPEVVQARYKTVPCATTGNKKRRQNSLLRVYCHDVHPAFVLTYDKLQGLTKARLVAVVDDLRSLKMGEMSYNKTYVGFSRVVRHEHLAILKPSTPSSLDYLLKLQSSDTVRAWHANYDDNGRWCDKEIMMPSVRKAFHRLAQDTLAALKRVDVDDDHKLALLQHKGLERLKGDNLTHLCRRCGVFFTTLSVSEKRRKLKPMWGAYLEESYGKGKAGRISAASASASSSAAVASSSSAAAQTSWQTFCDALRHEPAPPVAKPDSLRKPGPPPKGEKTSSGAAPPAAKPDFLRKRGPSPKGKETSSDAGRMPAAPSLQQLACTAAVAKAELWISANEQLAPCRLWVDGILQEINTIMPWERPHVAVRPPWLAGMRLRARIADYYHAETNTFKYHLRNWLCKCGFEVVLDSAAASQTGVSCGVVASAVQAHLLHAGAQWFTSPSAAAMADAVSTNHVEWAYQNRRNWEDPQRLEMWRADHTRFISNFEIEKLLPLLCTRICGADRAAEWSQHDANLKVTAGRPDHVVVWIARFLHDAREAIHTSGAFSGTRRYISNTVGGTGLHWIAVVVSVETVNNPP